MNECKKETVDKNVSALSYTFLNDFLHHFTMYACYLIAERPFADNTSAVCLICKR